MPFIHQIPYKARPSYYWYSHAQMMEGIFTGAAYELLNFVARKTIGSSEFQISMFLFFISLGMLSGVLMPQLLRIRSKMQYIAWTSMPSKALFICLAFISDPATFFIIAGAGLFLCKMYVPINAAVLKSNFPDTHRGSIVGHVRSLELACTVAASAIAGALLSWNEQLFRIIFPVAGLCGIMGVVYFIRIKERNNSSRETIVSVKKVWRALRTDHFFLLYQIIFSIAGLANLTGLPLYVLYITDVLHAGYFEIALSAGVLFNLASVASLRWWGRLLDRHPNPMLIRSGLTLAWCLHPLFFAFATDMTLIYAAYVYFGFLMAGGILNWMLGSLYFCSDEDAAVYATIHTWFNGVRGMIAPLLGYFLYRWIGFTATFYIISATMFINSFLMFGLYLATRDSTRFRPASP